MDDDSAASTGTTIISNGAHCRLESIADNNNNNNNNNNNIQEVVCRFETLLLELSTQYDTILQEENADPQRHNSSGNSDSSNGCDRYDDLFQRLLIIMSELPDLSLSLLRRQDTTEQGGTVAEPTTQQYETLDDVVASILDGDRTSIPPYLTIIEGWTHCFCTTEFGGPNATRNNNDTHLWETALVLLSQLTNHITPLEIHSAASMRSLDTDGNHNNNNNSNIPFDCFRCQMYSVTCILLCCQAIRTLGRTCCGRSDTTTTVVAVPRPRWQRCQSLLYETIQQYDRLNRHQLLHGCTTTEKGQNRVLPLISIWIKHVVPTTSRWNQILWNEYFPLELTTTTTDRCRIWRWSMAYEAVTIYLTGRLVMLLVTQRNDPAVTSALMKSLVAAMNEHVVFGHIEYICEHFWRASHRLQMSNGRQLYRNALESDDGPTRSIALMYYTSPNEKTDDDEDDDDDDERQDLLCGVSSVWLNKDIALLCSVVWEIRPNVWSKDYQWHLFFPSVNDLLLTDETSDDMNAMQLTQRHAMISPYGYQLLSQLLSLSMIRSIPKPTNDNAPDSPLGTFQLLISGMVGDRDATYQSDRIKSIAESFRYVKLLMNVYQPSDQVDIVETLLRQCPYPNVRPKIVDLLRNVIDWNDTSAEAKVWSFIDATFFVPLEYRLLHADTTITVSDINELVDDTELYVATLGLLHIWVTCKRSIPTFQSVVPLRDRLIHIHEALCSVERDDTPTTSQSSCLESPMIRPFQLNLLENGIKETIDILTKLENAK